jgi:hypothetical protein
MKRPGPAQFQYAPVVSLFSSRTIWGIAGLYTGGAFWTVPELLFEKKGLIPRKKQLLVEGSAASEPS